MRTVLLIIISLCLLNAADNKPLIREFIGLNGHFHFKPELYSQTCRLVRNYHNIKWDVKKLGDPITMPVCHHKVNWEKHVYGPWKKHGFETDICLQFSHFNHENPDYIKQWNQHLDWAYDYGHAVAEYFGPSGEQQLCTSIEIGNEPGNRFDEATWQKIVTHMAQGIRDADPKVKIVTATAHADAADAYSKNLDESYRKESFKKLYDVINVHTYAQTPKPNEHKSPWNRSYPEDSRIKYLQVIDEVIAWRDRHAPDKEIWVTEFGYDSVTPDAMDKRTGWAKKLDWQGVSDLMQAQYLLRSLLCFTERDVERAYIYFFNDKNEPSVHAAAGLTRNFKPKPSFWTVRQCYELLGDYRFSHIVDKSDSAWVFAFTHASDDGKQIWVAWSPTGTQSHNKDGYVGRTTAITLTQVPGQVSAIQAMAIAKGPATALPFDQTGRHLSLTVSESPAYIIINNIESAGQDQD